MKLLYLLSAFSLSAQIDLQTETRFTKPGAAPKVLTSTRYRAHGPNVRVDKAGHFVIVRLAEDRVQQAEAGSERYIETKVREMRRHARQLNAAAEPFTNLPPPPPIQWQGKSLAGIACRTASGTITAYPLPENPKHSQFAERLDQLGLLEHPAQLGCVTPGKLYARLTLTTDEGAFTTAITNVTEKPIDPNIFHMPAGWRRVRVATPFKKL